MITKKPIGLFIIFMFCSTISKTQSTFVTIAGGDLYKVNLNNCSHTFVGATGHGFGDIAFTPNGKLWGIVSGDIYEIDTSDASVSLVGNTGYGAIDLEGLNDTTLIMEFLNSLYRVSTIDASATLIGSTGPYAAVGDLVWFDHELYMSSSPYLVKISLNSSATAITALVAVNPSGSPIPACEGMGTLAGTENSLIGFSGQNAYKICYADGSYELLCPTVVPDGIPGGASPRLPVQIHHSPCIPTGVENKILLEEINISPNPVSSSGSLHIFASLHTVTFTVSLYDQQGREIFKKENIADITLGEYNLSTGIYIATIQTAGLVKQQLVMVE